MVSRNSRRNKKVRRLKKCNRCNKKKKLDSFYKNNKAPDGKAYACKDCQKADAKKRYEANREQVLDRAKRNRTFARKMYLRQWRRDNPDKVRKHAAKQRLKKLERYIHRNNYRRNNPMKHMARAMVRAALESEILTKKPCVICGEEKVDGHHTDYNKPLEIMWLCRTHHAAWHRVFVAEQPNYGEDDANEEDDRLDGAG